MSTVDERIVEMRFDNKQFEDGVQTTVRSLKELKKGLDLEESAKSLTNLDKAGKTFSLAGIAEGVETISNKFTTLGIIGVTVLQDITRSALSAATELAKALTIDPVTDGLSEYETKINAIGTILTNTESKGTTIDDVTKALDELNLYADKTIYNFAEMTRNIGAFTTKGVDLDTSVYSIKGIANLGAAVGASASDVARGMYQLSQAVGTGLKLIDWKSVENANLSGEIFEKRLISTAKEMGTWTEKEQKMIDSGVLFRNTLETGWATAEVLTTTLRRLGEDEALTKKAGEVRTLTQLLGTMKESVGSGWATSWEQIFGNKEQATEYFTALNDGFSELIGASTDARNEMLKFWNQNGGRSALIEALSNSFNTLLSILRPVGEAFREVFPPMTGQRLVEISEKIRDLTKNFKIGEKTGEKIKTTFKGLFSVINIGKNGLIAVANGFKKLIEFSLPAGEGLLSFTSFIGEFLISLDDAIETSDTFNGTIEKMEKGLKNIFSNISKLIRKASPTFYKFAGVFSDTFGKLRDGIIEAFDGASFNSILTAINGGVFAGILMGLKKLINSFGEITDTAGGFLGSVTGILDGVKGSLLAYQTQLKSGTLLKIATSIALLAASLVALSLIDPARLSSALSAMSIVLAELLGSMAVIDKISMGTGFMSMGKIVIGMIGLATAVLILSGAMTKLAELDWNGLIKGLVGIGVIMAELAIFMKMTDFSGMGLSKGLGFLALAAGINILASAVKKFSEIDTDAMIKGLLGVAAVLGELAIFVNVTGDAKRVISTAIGLTILGAAMVIFAKAIKDMGSMSWEELGRGLLGMAGGLTALVIALNLMPKNTILIGTGLVAVSAALLILSKALSSIGGMSWEEIGKGLLTLGGSLLIIAVAVQAMNSALPGAAALLVISGALMLLSVPLEKFGKMSLGEIGKSLLMLAGVFVVLGLGAIVLAPLIPVILGLAASIALFGAGCLAIGAGVLAFSAALTALSVSGTAVVGMIVALVTGLVGLIPFVLETLGRGIIALARVLGEGAPVLAEAISKVVQALIKELVDVTPPLVDGVFKILMAILNTIVDYIPQITEAGIKIIIGFLKGIADNIEEVVKTSIEVVINFIEGVASMIPEVIQAGFDLMISFINGLANCIRDNTPRMIDAVINLMSAIVESGLKVLINSISGFSDIGSKIMNSGFIQGIKSKISDFISTLKDMASDGVKALTDKIGDFVNVGKDVIAGFVRGIKSKISSVIDSITDMIDSAIDSAKDALGIDSPSKEFAKMGMYADQGFAKGLKDFSSIVASTSKDIGQSAIDALKGSISNISNIIEGKINAEPIIRPVLDLSNVESGSRRINAIFGQGRGINLSSVVDKIPNLTSINGNNDVSQQNPSKAAQGNNFNFVQNNYSPKPLSRLEIYRQTRNQLSTLKGLVNNA